MKYPFPIMIEESSNVNKKKSVLFSIVNSELISKIFSKYLVGSIGNV